MITGKTGNFFESKVRLEKTTEDGTLAKFNELYVVEAMSFTECEAKLNGNVSPYSQGDFEVLTEARAKYGEIFFSDNVEENLFYKVKVDFIAPDERTGKEKHTKADFLVQGSSIESAKRNVDEAMGGTDFRVLTVSETAIQEVIC